jgi:hypothetical protein
VANIAPNSPSTPITQLIRISSNGRVPRELADGISADIPTGAIAQHDTSLFRVFDFPNSGGEPFGLFVDSSTRIRRRSAGVSASITGSRSARRRSRVLGARLQAHHTFS